MKYSRTLLSSFLAILFFVVPASAAVVSCKECVADSKEVLSQMDAAKSTPLKLIAAAEAHCKGQAVGFVFELVKGVWDARVYCVSEGKVQTVSLDAAGAVTKMEEATGMDSMISVAKAMFAEKVTLAKVVEASDKRSRGKTIAVVAVSEEEDASFDCFCAAGETLVKVFVDGAGKAGKADAAEAIPGSGHTFHEQKQKPKKAG